MACCGKAVASQRYALKREVAGIYTGFFRRVCPIKEPGEKILIAKGYVSCVKPCYDALRETNVHANLLYGMSGRTAKVRFTGFYDAKA